MGTLLADQPLPIIEGIALLAVCAALILASMARTRSRGSGNRVAQVFWTLVPAPWVGPVWAPLVVSAALIGSGLAAARRLRSGCEIAVGPVRAVAAGAGGGLVIASFLVDANRILAGDSGAWTGWPVFWAGMALATAATVSALAGKSTAPPTPELRSLHGSEGRPSVGAPD